MADRLDPALARTALPGVKRFPPGSRPSGARHRRARARPRGASALPEEVEDTASSAIATMAAKV